MKWTFLFQSSELSHSHLLQFLINCCFVVVFECCIVLFFGQRNYKKRRIAPPVTNFKQFFWKDTRSKKLHLQFYRYLNLCKFALLIVVHFTSESFVRLLLFTFSYSNYLQLPKLQRERWWWWYRGETRWIWEDFTPALIFISPLMVVSELWKFQAFALAEWMVTDPHFNGNFILIDSIALTLTFIKVMVISALAQKHYNRVP